MHHYDLLTTTLCYVFLAALAITPIALLYIAGWALIRVVRTAKRVVIPPVYRASYAVERTVTPIASRIAELAYSASKDICEAIKPPPGMFKFAVVILGLVGVAALFKHSPNVVDVGGYLLLLGLFWVFGHILTILFFVVIVYFVDRAMKTWDMLDKDLKERANK